MEKTNVTYCLRVKGTEELVRYSTRNNEGGYACYPVTYRLETGRWAEDYPVYEQATLEKLQRALMRDTPDYNADYDTPMHGGLEISSLEIVERRVVEQHTVVPFEMPPEFRVVEQLKKPAFLLRRYAGVETLPDDVQYLTFVEIPEGETTESVKRFEGQQVPLANGWGYLMLSKIGLTLPEEYEDLLRGGRFAAVTRVNH
jgi:hypothetical protein